MPGFAQRQASSGQGMFIAFHRIAGFTLSVVAGWRSRPAAGDPPVGVAVSMMSDDAPVRPATRGGAKTARPTARARLAAAKERYLALVDDEYHQVARFVMFNGADREQALDATQAAFTEAWDLIQRGCDQWEAVRNPRAWLRTVAVRHYRRPPDRRREPPTVLDDCPGGDAPWGGQDPAELTAQTLDVLRALSGLDQDLRVIMAFYVDGFRPIDIAAELGVSDQRVRDQLKKGRAILAGKLGLSGKGRGTHERGS
jgi:RNA polymerase sigma factor (sigma-70 family)